MQRGIDILLSIKMEKTKSVETNQVGQYKYRKQNPQIKFKQKEHAMAKKQSIRRSKSSLSFSLLGVDGFF